MSVKYDNLEQVITEYISQELAYDRPDLLLTNDLRLIEERIIDSMGIFRLVNFMEEQFGIYPEPEELELSNFETIENIKSFMLSKL